MECFDHCRKKDNTIGPVGIVQAVKLRKIANTREGGKKCVMSTQEYMRKVVEDVGKDEDFRHGSWVSMVDFVNANGGIQSQRSLRNNIWLNTSRYPYKGGDYGKDITVRVALILHHLLVFCPKPSLHYLNIKTRSVVKVFHKDKLLEMKVV
ncbi:hypothetical protein CTI12_AA461030 [Artemisia annua]|uniref:Uncharacterized protein n=1 Tax=Artemisia annua TaxID=35608 RepID=A0A2U1LRE4_ARTAN|nr:hypothetical protein CTI12_AA461030 [Artemisia annua]